MSLKEMSKQMYPMFRSSFGYDSLEDYRINGKFLPMNAIQEVSELFKEHPVYAILEYSNRSGYAEFWRVFSFKEIKTLGHFKGVITHFSSQYGDPETDFYGSHYRIIEPIGFEYQYMVHFVPFGAIYSLRHQSYRELSLCERSQ